MIGARREVACALGARTPGTRTGRRVGAFGERGEVRIVLDQHLALEGVDESGVHGRPVALVAARRVSVGADGRGDADDGQQPRALARPGLLEHLVDERDHGLEPFLGRGGSGVEIHAVQGAVGRAAGSGELAAAEVRGAGGEGVLAGVDRDQDGGVGLQGEVPGRPAALDGTFAPGGHLVQPPGLLELRAHAQHGRTGQAGRGHRVGRCEVLRPQRVLEQRLPVGPAHQLGRAGTPVLRC